MRIVVITGSPHKNGTSALLADKFIQGATEAGNEVFRFNTAFENVHPCIGCDTCECGKKPCVFKDGMTELYTKLLKADMVVFVTPLLRGTNKKAMLLVSAASTEERIMNGVVGSYHETTHYLGWKDMGILLAYGCYSRSDMEKTDYPEQAYQLGRSIK